MEVRNVNFVKFKTHYRTINYGLVCLVCCILQPPAIW